MEFPAEIIERESTKFEGGWMDEETEHTLYMGIVKPMADYNERVDRLLSQTESERSLW